MEMIDAEAVFVSFFIAIAICIISVFVFGAGWAIYESFMETSRKVKVRWIIAILVFLNVWLVVFSIVWKKL